jgi:hypothetical protein
MMMTASIEPADVRHVRWQVAFALDMRLEAE